MIKRLIRDRLNGIRQVETVSTDDALEEIRQIELASLENAYLTNLESVEITSTQGRAFAIPKSRYLDYFIALRQLQPLETITWTLADNTRVETTREELEEVTNLAEAQIFNLNNTYEADRVDLLNADLSFS